MPTDESMAMQTLDHELDPPQATWPSLPVADASPAVTTAEVQRLRQRVAQLEAELAIAHRTIAQHAPTAAAAPGAVTAAAPAPAAPPLTSIDLAPAPPAAAVNSEFSTPVAPAVVSVAATTEPVEQDNVAQPGFAQAWTEQATDLSFEERFAEKAFFAGTTVDEESRSWLLEN